MNPEVRAMKINVGISDKDRASICESLGRVLATTYSLQLQTQHSHWNVKGPFFDQLHLLFQRQYEELAVAVDNIAERIRALGHPAPGSFDDFLRLSAFKQRTDARNADEMLAQLLEGHEILLNLCKQSVLVAENGNDEATSDMLTERVEVHGKAAWMLRATLEK
jgi:starvation-inducible DNA-binding protein